MFIICDITKRRVYLLQGTNNEHVCWVLDVGCWVCKYSHYT